MRMSGHTCGKLILSLSILQNNMGESKKWQGVDK